MFSNFCEFGIIEIWANGDYDDDDDDDDWNCAWVRYDCKLQRMILFDCGINKIFLGGYCTPRPLKGYH